MLLLRLSLCAAAFRNCSRNFVDVILPHTVWRQHTYRHRRLNRHELEKSDTPKKAKKKTKTEKKMRHEKEKHWCIKHKNIFVARFRKVNRRCESERPEVICAYVYLPHKQCATDDDLENNLSYIILYVIYVYMRLHGRDMCARTARLSTW